MRFSILSVAFAAALVDAHGIVQIPPSRSPGPASLKACGKSVIDLIKADNTSHVEGLPEAAHTDSTYNATACNLWLCKGLQYEGDAASVQKFTPGQVLPMHVYLRVLHAGTANVSLIDTKTDTIIGQQLLYWDNYADEKLAKVPANNTDFSVTIPTDIKEGTCASPGDCVSYRP